MPLGRLWTFAVAQAAGRMAVLPFAGVLSGCLGLVIALALVYCFVRRELGHSFYGLAALILFGVTAVYQQAVYWFAAGFSVFALDTVLLALLAAQQYRRTGLLQWLLACSVGCALAPCWFASGVLAGPLCCLYLASGRREPADEPLSAGSRRPLAVLPLLTPLLGTAAFLAVSLPQTAAIIQNLEHYRAQNRTAVEAFQPLVGAWYTCRSVVDNLAPGAVGVTGVTVGPFFALPLFAGLVAVGIWWARRSLRRRLALVGAGLILGSYLLIYSGRAMLDYDRSGLYTATWCRYHLQPQLGLVLLVCGGLPAWDGRWFRLDAAGRLTRGQARALACLLAVCFLIQAPRGLFCYYPSNPRQALTLDLIDRADAFCKERHISAETARQDMATLRIFRMPESSTVIDGWEFLRGSDEPQDWTPEEVRAMMEAER